MRRLASIVQGSIGGHDFGLEVLTDCKIKAVGKRMADVDGDLAGGSEEVVVEDQTDDAASNELVPGIEDGPRAFLAELALAMATEDGGRDLDGDVGGRVEAAL